MSERCVQTVAELITLLQKLPQGHKPLIDLHSDHTGIRAPVVRVGVDSGGGWVRLETEHSKLPENLRLRAHGYVYIGPSQEEP